MLPTKTALGIALALLVPVALGQTNLGELLDAGAKHLSAQDFQDQLVQRTLTGPYSATGISLEWIYAGSGRVEASGTAPAGIGIVRVGGEWRIEANEKICASLRIGGPMAAGGPVSPGASALILPERCQSWYKLGERYFLSDSDTDRSAKVLPRTLKQ